MQALENENLKENHNQQAAEPEIQEYSDEEQPLILDDQKSNIHKKPPKIQDEQQKGSNEQVLERQNKQEQQGQPIVNEQLRPRLDEEQMSDEIRQVSDASRQRQRQRQQQQQQQQQQRPHVVERQRPARQNEEQEQLIPDEVRQMPDEKQQQMIREIFRQELRLQSQRNSNNNKTTLFAIIFSTLVMIGAIFFQVSRMDYVPRQEFEDFKTENENGLVPVEDNYRKDFSEQEAYARKRLEEFLASMMETNTATKELPNYTIENLLENEKLMKADISKMQKEILELKDKNKMLENSLKNVNENFRRIKEWMERPPDNELMKSLFLTLAIIAFAALMSYLLDRRRF